MNRGQLARAGELIRQHVKVPPSGQSETSMRVALLEALSRKQKRRSHRWVAVFAPALVLVLVVLVWRLPDSTPQNLAFTVGSHGTPGEVGAYVATRGQQPLSLQFSEGSSISLSPETRARVTGTTPRGAVVLVEAGRAQVDVVHRPDSDWRIEAGPYSIAVKGTSFDVAFEAPTQTLEVVMRSGVVSVTGPGIATPVEISGRQRFVHSVAARSAASTAALSPQAPEPGSTLPRGAPEADIERPGPSSAPSVGSPGPRPTPARADWPRLAANGEFRRVLNEADARGLDATLQEAPQSHLMALATAARFAGRTDLAARAYRRVRERFAGSRAAADAAFLLGRMTESGSPSTAIGWYDRYVTEAPAGSFVAEALGRKMIALEKAGNATAAKDAAVAYLKRFPGGPYAGVASEMTAP